MYVYTIWLTRIGSFRLIPIDIPCSTKLWQEKTLVDLKDNLLAICQRFSCKLKINSELLLVWSAVKIFYTNFLAVLNLPKFCAVAIRYNSKCHFIASLNSWQLSYILTSLAQYKTKIAYVHISSLTYTLSSNTTNKPIVCFFQVQQSALDQTEIGVPSVCTNFLPILWLEKEEVLKWINCEVKSVGRFISASPHNSTKTATFANQLIVRIFGHLCLYILRNHHNQIFPSSTCNHLTLIQPKSYAYNPSTAS